MVYGPDPDSQVGESILDGSQWVKSASVQARLGFVRKVYGILSAQLLLTVAIASPISMLGPDWVVSNLTIFYMSIGVLLATMCVMICCSDLLRQFPTNYIFLFILTAAMSTMVGFTSAFYTWQSVVLAAGITTGIFLGMTAYACFTKKDFTGAGPYLFGALLTLCMFGLVLSFMSLAGIYFRWMLMLYDAIGVVLFTFYIVYDTQMILGGDRKHEFSVDDYVFAALNLYLDIINIFLYLLSLFGNRR